MGGPLRMLRRSARAFGCSRLEHPDPDVAPGPLRVEPGRRPMLVEAALELRPLLLRRPPRTNEDPPPARDDERVRVGGQVARPIRSPRPTEAPVPHGEAVAGGYRRHRRAMGETTPPSGVHEHDRRDDGPRGEEASPAQTVDQEVELGRVARKPRVPSREPQPPDEPGPEIAPRSDAGGHRGSLRPVRPDAAAAC